MLVYLTNALLVMPLPVLFQIELYRETLRLPTIISDGGFRGENAAGAELEPFADKPSVDGIDGIPVLEGVDDDAEDTAATMLLCEMNSSC